MQDKEKTTILQHNTTFCKRKMKIIKQHNEPTKLSVVKWIIVYATDNNIITISHPVSMHLQNIYIYLEVKSLPFRYKSISPKTRSHFCLFLPGSHRTRRSHSIRATQRPRRSNASIVLTNKSLWKRQWCRNICSSPANQSERQRSF